MSQVKFKYEAELITDTCSKCGISFGMPDFFVKRRRQDHNTFYCPNGHALLFTGKSEAEKLKDELDQVKVRLHESLARENKIRIDNENTKKRVFNGVCPCCKRSFVKLHAHMQSKHPDYNPKKRV